MAHTGVDSSGNYIFADTFDYEFEEDVRINLDPNGKVIPSRSLKDPHASYFPQPDTYHGTYWDASSIHNICGVPNKMFYLLSEGGVHNNIAVTGIGADSNHVLNAAKVMYRAATQKWEATTNFNFAQAREKCIYAAKELDNENGTHWAYSVANAWAAVGVGQPMPLGADSYEPDNYPDDPNNLDMASSLSFNSTQNHSIRPVGDCDYLVFTLESRKGIKVETLDSTGDTYMYLYNSQGVYITNSNSHFG